MADRSSIEWTDATWNPVWGCTKVSPGCDHCYAEAITNRFGGPGAFEKVVLHPERLEKPLHWRKPRRVFVNSMSDLFHADVPNDFLVRVFAVMGVAAQHTFQVLTKRPGRMQHWLSQPAFWRAVERVSCGLGRDLPDAYATGGFTSLPNVWLGVSVEDQERADKRIPVLLDTPAAVHFISCEPLLGPVDLYQSVVAPLQRFHDEPNAEGGPIAWVIVGGESGPKARPMDVTWARSLRDQCRAAGVPVFVKQFGSNACDNGVSRPGQHWPNAHARRGSFVLDGAGVRFHIALADPKGGDIREFPEDLRIREFPR